MKNIVLFENERIEDLYPFSVMHCSWEIRCGALRLFEKIKFQFPKSKIHYHGRKKWLDSFNKRFDVQASDLQIEDTLFLSGNVIINKSGIEKIESIKTDEERFLLKSNNSPVGFYIRNTDAELESFFAENSTIDLNNPIFASFKNIEIDKESVDVIEYLWDAIFINGKQIEEDAQYLIKHHELFTSDHHGIHANIPTKVLVGKNVKFSPSVVLDASGGTIIISDNVKIMPQSTIIGPCYIGSNSVVKIGAKIYADNTIGEWCKVGGELENTIIHAYSNKQHEGFLGHSYICEWVNLGADTNNSDLKNTYGAINMVLPHKEVKTGRIFLGLMCGDHTKSGINSMFTTGTVAGVCGILVKEWFLPNFIKSFTWGGKSNSPTYRFDKAIETARIVMERRNRILSDEEIELLKIEYDKIS